MIRIDEATISQRLRAALENANHSSDGYAETIDVDESRLKCAAVLVPLFWQNDEWHLLFTRRTERVDSHKGQVSFPGGACDEGETTPEQTALRESREEIGIRAQDVRLLGRLGKLVTITDFLVTPVVGVIPCPYVFCLESAEVARVFSIPLDWLNDAANRWQFYLPDRKRNVIAYHPFDGELLWGATARMTINFLRAIGADAKDESKTPR